jgi:uncharacterized protein YeeX (DUF496 family)
MDNLEINEDLNNKINDNEKSFNRLCKLQQLIKTESALNELCKTYFISNFYFSF